MLSTPLDRKVRGGTMKWQPIETAPKGRPGFLATDDEMSCIEWLVAETDAGDFFNQNSGNYTKRKFWDFWRPLPEAPNGQS